MINISDLMDLTTLAAREEEKRLLDLIKEKDSQIEKLIKDNRNSDLDSECSGISERNAIRRLKKAEQNYGISIIFMYLSFAATFFLIAAFILK